MESKSTNVTLVKSEADFLWREYILHIDLYKFYFDLALKANLFFYVVTGSILGFYLSHHEVRLIRLSLLLPILMGGVFAGVFIKGAGLWENVVTNVGNIKENLSEQGVEIEKTPDIILLSRLLRIFGFIFFGVTISMILLWVLT